MQQGSDYIFAIQTKDFRFYKIENGLVTVNAQPYFLDFAPAGWADIAVQNIRNKRYWGIDRSVTIPLSYVEDGARILKNIFLNKGIEESVYLNILEQQLEYNPLPEGEIAYTSGQSPFTPNTTTTGTITGTPGATIYVKFIFDNPVPGDTIVVDFNSVIYVIDHLTTNLTNILTLPTLGVINFSIAFNRSVSSVATAGFELINSTDTTPGWGYWYKQRFRGEIDLSSYSHEGATVKATVLEDGLPKYLRSNENTTIELPMSDAEAINVKLDGIILHNKATYLLSNGLLLNDYRNHVVDLQLIYKEVDYVGYAFPAQRTVIDTATELAGTNQQFFEATVTGDVTIDYDFTLTVGYTPPPGMNPAAVMRVQVSQVNPDGSIHSVETLLERFAGFITGPFDLAGSITMNVIKGNKLFLWTFISPIGAGGSSNTFFTYSGVGLWRLTYLARFPATYIKAFRPAYLFGKYIEAVTEGEYSSAISSFLSIHSDKVFTSGNAIRGFDDAVLKWNFSDFFQFWDSFSSVGISEVAGKINIDEKQNLIDSNSIIDLVNPSELKLSVATEYLYNELSIGYPEISNDVGIMNGNEEFNTRYLFSLGTTKKPGVLDKVSKIKASCYEIEKIRITISEKETTDYKADNDVFVIHIEDTISHDTGNSFDHFNLDRVRNATTTGVIEDETVFNIGLSPHLNFKRNGPFLRSSLWLCDAKTLKYQTADKNNKLTFTDPDFGAIIEKADENIGGLGQRFFAPLIFDITLLAPDNMISILDINPLQIYRCQFYGATYKGILLKVSTGLASGKAQQWQLLSTADNDLTKLENYYG